MSIKSNLQEIKNNLPQEATLIAVSKTKPSEDILEAYNAGQKDFGENKAQELIQKQPNLPEGIRWHMIGHLQRNKVKQIAPFVHMIHAVDSTRLAKEINKQAIKNQRIINCLIQFHIAEEQSKFGFSMEEFQNQLKEFDWNNLSNINIRGVMGMATFTSDTPRIRREFKTLKKIFDHLKKDVFTHNDFEHISMGMSQDYKIAIEEGSTMVRVGSAIFGARNYQKNA